MVDLAQAWSITCSRPRAKPERVYVPWWLEARYGFRGDREG
jgi:hypothetical protein